MRVLRQRTLRHRLFQKRMLRQRTLRHHSRRLEALGSTAVMVWRPRRHEEEAEKPPRVSRSILGEASAAATVSRWATPSNS